MDYIKRTEELVKKVEIMTGKKIDIEALKNETTQDILDRLERISESIKEWNDEEAEQGQWVEL